MKALKRIIVDQVLTLGSSKLTLFIVEKATGLKARWDKRRHH